MTEEKNVWELFHDIEAPEYDDLGFTKNTLNEVDFLIDELGLSPGDSVLDVACGTGRHAVELASRGYQVTGIDISAGMLAQAKAKADAAGVSVEFIKGDATAFSFDKKFDAAICLCEGAFGLLSPADDAIAQPLAILENISNSLKPGAKSLFTILNGLRIIRNYSDEGIEKGDCEPMTLSMVTEIPPKEGGQPLRVRERGFVPTELTLLFRLAGMEAVNIWGGSAGSWNRKPLRLNEIEVMVVASKSSQ